MGLEAGDAGSVWSLITKSRKAAFHCGRNRIKATEEMQKSTLTKEAHKGSKVLLFKRQWRGDNCHTFCHPLVLWLFF